MNPTPADASLEAAPSLRLSTFNHSPRRNDSSRQSVAAAEVEAGQLSTFNLGAAPPAAPRSFSQTKSSQIKPNQTKRLSRSDNRQRFWRFLTTVP
jgi:hypothetical protein